MLLVLVYWLYRQARQVSSSTLLVKVERETSERVDQYKRKGEKRSLIHHVTSKKSGLF